jgi:single-stranded-DNA-specific exonuclease
MFFSKVAGVTFEGRQDVLEDILDEIDEAPLPTEKGWPLKVKREPNNPFDSNAIALHWLDGRSIGHVKREIAQGLAMDIDRGVLVKIYLTEITGNSFDQNLGANIFISVCD